MYATCCLAHIVVSIIGATTGGVTLKPLCSLTVFLLTHRTIFVLKPPHKFVVSAEVYFLLSSAVPRINESEFYR